MHGKAVHEPISEPLYSKDIVPNEKAKRAILSLHENSGKPVIIHTWLNSIGSWISIIFEDIINVPPNIIYENHRWNWCPEPNDG